MTAFPKKGYTYWDFESNTRTELAPAVDDTLGSAHLWQWSSWPSHGCSCGETSFYSVRCFQVLPNLPFLKSP